MVSADKIASAFAEKGFALVNHSRYSRNSVNNTHGEQFRFCNYTDVIDIAFAISNNDGGIFAIDSLRINDLAVDDIDSYCNARYDSRCLLDQLVASIIKPMLYVGECSNKTENASMLITQVYPETYQNFISPVIPTSEPAGLKFAMKYLSNSMRKLN